MEDLPDLAVELREVDHVQADCEEGLAKKPDFLKKKGDKKGDEKGDKKDDKKPFFLNKKKSGKKDDKKKGEDKDNQNLPPWLNKKKSKSNYDELWKKVNANKNKGYPNFAKGDHVKNTNSECKHFNSEGVVNDVKKLPDDEGVTVGYTCSNAGKSWTEGDKLFKTPDQLKKIKGAHQRKG